MFSGDFWRPEIWHPLSVHFPISLLLISTLTVLISFFVKEVYKRPWQIASTMLLLVGCLSAWAALYTGNVADGVVARKICDPTILKDHEIASQNMVYLFNIAAALHIIFFISAIKAQLRKFAFYISFIFMLIGCGYLLYTGHLGASLVYQQGAGVKNHVVDCDEYVSP
jgi:uncharacterized membrane protein